MNLLISLSLVLINKKNMSKQRANKFLEIFEQILSISEKFTSIMLADGTEVTYEGELVAGVSLRVKGVDADGNEIESALPEGTYELGGDMQGKSIVVDADGKLVELIEASKQSKNEDFSAAFEDLVKRFAYELKSINDKIHAIENSQKEKFEAISKYLEKGEKFSFQKTEVNNKTKKLF